jgi:hypothetical protein
MEIERLEKDFLMIRMIIMLLAAFGAYSLYTMCTPLVPTKTDAGHLDPTFYALQHSNRND